MIIATLLCETTMAIIIIVKDEIADTPAARPSSPSMRLTELVMATIHNTVTGIEK